MQIRAKEPHRLVRAFTGLDIVAYEWRPVPDGGEDEALRLEADGFCELLHDDPVAEPEPERARVVEVDATRSAEELAAEYGLDLYRVHGTGKDGRIILADVQRIIFEEEE